MAEAQLETYFEGLTSIARRGDAREESFYSSLEAYLETTAKEQGAADIQITTLPRPTEAGNPDFRVWNGSDRIVGYIEAKAPTESNLDRIQNSEQLKRYRETFPNLILTNFLEFRLYRDGRLVDQVQAGRPFVLIEIKHQPPVEKAEELAELLGTFFDFSLPKAYTAEELAVALARRTRFLRDIVRQQLEIEKSAREGDLSGFFQAFQRFLIGNLTPESFADLYAQTITYGLFAARTRARHGFSRRAAYQNIPQTIGILCDVFRFISLEDPPAELEWVVDDIAEVLAVAEVGEILASYYREGKGSDPIVHFYETFLAEYDPEQRERRGVYYTPEPVVSYIVRSVHEILKEKFDRPDGLADRNVTLLDPAAGTMTFVAKAAQVAVDEFKEKYGEGGVAQFIKDHILQNFYAFELMMAPYAVGHMKMAFFLEELGYRMTEDDRFQFYLTNTLEMEELEQTELPGMKSLSEESKLAAEVKKEKPILVILGNPPYSGHSANRGEWILDLIEDYKQVDGEALRERNPKWLQDDYVKFLRFSQWKIQQTGQGIVAMITNHGYLDNPTFRGMRWSLLQSFDELYLLDLHGNSLRREKAPDGSPDENVLDIRQGVAISMMIRREEHGSRPGVPAICDIWGSREQKYRELQSLSWATVEWLPLEPQSPLNLMVRVDSGTQAQFSTFIPLDQMFDVYGVGITSARDDMVIDFEMTDLVNRIRLFKHARGSDGELHSQFDIREKKGWSIREAWESLQDIADSEIAELVIPIFYRPFDVRWVFYHDSLVWRTARRVLEHLTRENLALVTPKRVEIAGGWQHAFVTESVAEHVAVSLKTTDYVFPARLWEEFLEPELFSHAGGNDQVRHNLDSGLMKEIERANLNPDPFDQIRYSYAILFAPYYRSKYQEPLSLGHPRIPFTSIRELGNELQALGDQLISLHLLRSDFLKSPIARFHGEGEPAVARTKRQGFRYDPKRDRVFINEDQYFAPVPLPLWEYQIGGYQVLHKWLKDRKGRTLTLDEIQTYCRIVTAVAKTIEIQEEIDALYPQVEENLIEINLS